MNRIAWAALAAVAIPLVALFGPVLVADRSFAMRDAAHFYYPLYEWCCQEWAAGRVPLWNPYENCGLPVLADTTSSVFYPGKLVFLLPVDFAFTYKLYVIGHVVLAAATSYVAARAWKASHAAAAIAAMSYACGGGVVFQYCNVVFLVGAAWLPLAALAIDRMLRGPSWRAAICFGIVLALMILGGDPQMAYHALLIAGLYALLLSFTSEQDRRLSLRIGLVGVAAIVGFLLAAVQILPSSEATKYSERAAFNRPRNIYEAAAVLRQADDAQQPRGETRGQSILRGFFEKSEPGSHHDLAYDFSIGPWRLVEYFWPNIGGRMFPTNRRWFSLLPPEGRTWTPTLYLGLLPAILGLACFRLRKGELRERWLSWLVLIFTLASFGFYGLGWLIIEMGGAFSKESGDLKIAPAAGGVYWLFVTFLPTYIYFRYPAKLLPLVSLGLSQLAAVGWDRAAAERRPWLDRVLLWLGSASAVVAFAVWCLGPGLFGKVNRGDSSLGPFDGSGAFYDLLLALVQAAVVALAGRWLLKKVWDEPQKASQWRGALLGLTAVELALANAWLVVSAPADLWRNEPAVAAAIRAIPMESDAAATAVPPRVFRGSLAGWRPPSFRQKASPDRMAEVAQWEHDTLFPKYHLPSSVSLVESYGSIKLMDYESLLFIAKQHGPRQSDKSTLPQPTALRLLGAEALLLPEKHQPEFAERVANDREGWPENTALWQMTSTLPRAWIVHEVEMLPPLPFPLRIEAADKRTKEVLFPGGKPRDFRRKAVVETDKPPLGLIDMLDDPAPGSETARGEFCRITHYDPQHVVIEANLVRPGLVVLGDAWFPGWGVTCRWKPPGYTDATGPMKAHILRTNRVLRGVWAPSGTSEIEMRYRPDSFVRGAAISVVSWTLLIVTGLFAARQRRARRPTAAGQMTTDH